MASSNGEDRQVIINKARLRMFRGEALDIISRELDILAERL